MHYYLFIAFYTIFIFPNGYALAFEDAKVHFGASMALMGALQMLVFMFSSLIISILPEKSFIPMAFMFFLSGLLGLIGLLSRKWLLAQ